ncbi:hypothetical protein HAX54_050911 [Datura stramonium]|uniref:Uncharacterized protein n=1 Tax=Datura stramonium TaxID=4076 RepID=A0ABS8SXY0_DATST|nr:hypothetical protein [Datura stramonium]
MAERMKQSTIIQSASFDEAEIEVSDILLNLKALIEESESRSRVPPLSPSSKRRRSDRSLDFNSSLPDSVERNSQVEEEEEEDGDNVEIEPKSVKLKSEATSPDTPLSFSPRESADEPKQYSSDNEKSSERKTRDKLMRKIEKLTRCREVLRGELENVRSYYDSQKAYNLELKAKREKVMTNLNGQGSETCHTLQYPIGQLPQAQSFSSSAYGLGSVDLTGPIGIPPYHKYQYPMGQLPQAQPMLSSANRLGFMNHTGPVGIPHLNVNLVDWAFTMNSLSHFEHNRDIAERKAQYAEARRKRILKRIEMKRSSGLIRPQKRDRSNSLSDDKG